MAEEIGETDYTEESRPETSGRETEMEQEEEQEPEASFGFPEQASAARPTAARQPTPSTRFFPEPRAQRVGGHPGQVMIEVNRAPSLRSPLRPAVMSFKQQYNLYCERIDATNRETGSGFVPVPMKGCIDPEILHTLAVYELETSIEELTEDQVQKWVDDLVGQTQKMAPHAFDALVRKTLKIDLDVDLVKDRYFVLFMSHQRLARQNAWEDFFDKFAKESILHIVNVLEPFFFREQIEFMLQTTHAHLLT
ncbi:MAG: hypothetical protein ACRDCK_03340, partial [Plesiomonas shigelloides]